MAKKQKSVSELLEDAQDILAEIQDKVSEDEASDNEFEDDQEDNWSDEDED